MKKLKRSSWIDDNENITLMRYTAEEIEAEHSHDFIEIEYIWNGGGYQSINGKSGHVERGDLLFFNYEDSHSIEPVPDMEITNCLLNPEFVSEELINSENALDILNLSLFKDFSGGTMENLLPRIKFTGKDLIELETVLELMHKEFENKQIGYKIVLKSYVNILIAKIFRNVRKADSASIYSEVGKLTPKVLKYIEENYSRKLSLNELSKISCYNPTYFSKMLGYNS